MFLYSTHLTVRSPVVCNSSLLLIVSVFIWEYAKLWCPPIWLPSQVMNYAALQLLLALLGNCCLWPIHPGWTTCSLPAKPLSLPGLWLSFPFMAPRALPAFLEHLLKLENRAPSSGHMWSWNTDPWTPCALFQAMIETTLLDSEQPLRGHIGKLVEKFSDTDFWIPLFQMPSG